MSRKGRVPIGLPKGVQVSIVEKKLTVKGPKGSLTKELADEIHVNIEEDKMHVGLNEKHSDAKNIHGLYWALINNMVKGVSEGFMKKLEMVGVGFRAAVQGQLLDLQVGFSHPTKLSIPNGIEVTVEKNTLIQVKGIDKQAVGQFAADIRWKRPPEPYKGKGIRYADEYVRRKAGKSGKK